MDTLSHALDNAIWNALSGPHRALGAVGSRAGVYDADVSPFAGLADATPAAFEQLRSLAAPGRDLVFSTRRPLDCPVDWHMSHSETLEQFVCAEATGPAPPPDALARLAEADAAAMLALAEETKPGPFYAGTVRFGGYVGVRDAPGGALVAMAGHRMRLAGAVEISAVCTAASHRGKGLARKLVGLLTAEALAQGLTPFLHVRTANASAIALYETLGYRHRATMILSVARAIADPVE